jgi:hypothetical protein
MKNATLTSSIEALPTIKGWDKLTDTERKTVVDETLETSKALHAVSEARLAVGEHLYTVKQILEPHKLFEKWLKAMFHLSRATAYRYMDLYVAAKDIFPKPVLQVAMSRPDDRLTLKAIKAAPKPPKTDNIVAINKYLDKVQHGPQRESEATPLGTEYLTKLLFHGMRVVLNRAANRNRRAVFETALGYLLTELGIDSITCKAREIPDTFYAKRGRPVTAAKAA